MREGLLAAASRREFAAVTADGLAGYRIPDTSAGRKPAGDLLEFLIIQKAGANPAKHTVCFHRMLLPIYQKVIISGDKPGEERRNTQNPEINPIMNQSFQRARGTWRSLHLAYVEAGGQFFI